MANFKEYPIAFLLVGLFIVAMIGFGGKLAQNYGHNETLIKDENFDFGKIESRVLETSKQAEGWGETFRSDNPLLALGGLVLFSIWGIGQLIWGSVTGTFSIMTDGATAVFGIPPIVTGVLTAILIISLIFALYKLLRAGE
jgi:hypothetical protein